MTPDAIILAHKLAAFLQVEINHGARPANVLHALMRLAGITALKMGANPAEMGTVLQMEMEVMNLGEERTEEKRMGQEEEPRDSREGGQSQRGDILEWKLPKKQDPEGVSAVPTLRLVGNRERPEKPSDNLQREETTRGDGDLPGGSGDTA